MDEVAIAREADVASSAVEWLDAPMKSETGKLPKWHSYPLKPTVLEEALTSAGIVIETHLIRNPGNLFDAHFWPASQNVPSERLYIRAGSVPIEEAANARHRLENHAVPTLVNWVCGILALDRESPVRREKQHLSLQAFLSSTGR